MAGYDLIDLYIDEVAGRLQWRRDLDELTAELGDHLYLATSRLVLEGQSVEAAQRRALDRFGPADCVATAIVTTPYGAVAVPTSFTRRSGRAAVAGAVMWPTVPAGWWLSEFIETHTGRWEGGARIAYTAGNVALIAATALTVFLVLGLVRRQGGIGVAGLAGSIAAALAVVLSVFGWFVVGWGLLLAIALALVGAATMRVGISPRLPAAALASAWVIAAAVWCALRALEAGGVDEWGNYPAVDLSALTVGTVFVTFGLLGLGRWLADEMPADGRSTGPSVQA